MKSSPVTSSEEEVTVLRARIEAFQSVVDALPFAIFWKDRTSSYLGSNQRFATYAGAARPSDLIGRTDHELAWKPEETAAFRADDQEVMTTGSPKLNFIEPQRSADGIEHWLETNKLPLRSASGEVIGVMGWYEDITERKLTEEQAQRKDERIRAQAEELEALATPLLPVADGVLVMPLIGQIDQARTQQVMATLLAGVAHHGARTAILDVTGVQQVDASVVSALMRAAQAVRLLGAEAIVTGIRPDVAQVIVTIGGDLRHLTVLSDLKSGVAHALRR